MKIVRIGSGAGFSGDRKEPALEATGKGEVQCLGLAWLAARTIATAQQTMMIDPSSGHDPLLVDRM